MQKKDDIKKIINRLKKRYPTVSTQLNYKNAFELLIATILSAQCTDKQVNGVTKNLFKNYPTPEAFSQAEIKNIKKIIYSTGFYNNKAKNIKKCATDLFEKHNSEVPANINDLTKLAGVGRKTANVVLSSFFGIPSMVVDTHISRISQRLGLVKTKNAEKIETDLKKIIPKKEWNSFSLRLIYFGREVCTARNPKCNKCELKVFCTNRLCHKAFLL